jgi:hypothetical protein
MGTKIDDPLSLSLTFLIEKVLRLEGRVIQLEFLMSKVLEVGTEEMKSTMKELTDEYMKKSHDKKSVD